MSGWFGLKYIIRLDDVCPQMDWDKFWKVKEILVRHKVTAVLGVIPENKDKKISSFGGQSEGVFRKEIDFLIRQKGWELAQHGDTHELKQSGGVLKLYPKGEFPGLSDDEQLGKIRKGKEILESWGYEVKYFYPPAHAYDAGTLAALRSLGFEAVLDGVGFFVWDNNGLLHIPQLVHPLLHFLQGGNNFPLFVYIR